MRFRPSLFWLAGFLWLTLSSLTGLALFLGMILGKPLPPALRLIHVHGALVGGVAQIIVGAMLAFIAPLLMTGRDRPESHPILFVAVNGGAIGLVLGFAAHQYTLVAVAGLFIALAFLSLLSDLAHQSRISLVSPPLNIWFYGTALLALLIGLGFGEAMAFRAWPQALLGQGRLAHIHLNLLGFVTMTIVGTMHNLFPTVLNGRLHSPRLARLTFRLLPAGILLLVAGFLLSQVVVQIAAGCVLVLGVGLYAFNMVKTWLGAGRPRGAAADHLLLATGFLCLATLAGTLVAVNALGDPPAVPFGTLHLIAYTHLGLIGFVLQTIMGALSHLLPITLAVGRVKTNKKRGPYLDQLTGVIDRWRGVQVGAMSLGTMGLMLVAALVWQLPLASVEVQAAAAISVALLLIGLALFAVKVGRLTLSRPPE